MATTSYIAASTIGNLAGTTADLLIPLAGGANTTLLATPPPPPPPGPIGTYTPTRATTGLQLAGNPTLTAYNGDYTINKNGQRAEGLDIFGRVVVNSNVTDWYIGSCRVRGSNNVPLGNDVGLITINGGAARGVIDMVDLVPDILHDGSNKTSVQFDGVYVRGDTTVRRCWVEGVVDAFKVNKGIGFLLEGNANGDLAWFDVDPLQGGTFTHNDVVQILSMTSGTVQYNNWHGFTSSGQWGDGDSIYASTGYQSNSVLQLTQNNGPSYGLHWNYNLQDGGGASLNINDKTASYGIVSVEIIGNKFGRNQRLQGAGGDDTYTVLMTAVVQKTTSGNIYADTSTPVRIRTNG